MDAEDAKTYRHRAATWRGRASEFPADSPKWQECLNIAHQYDNLADLIAGRRGAQTVMQASLVTA
jgi:hypothetical protein